MSASTHPLISVVVPLYNESASILAFHKQLQNVIEQASQNSYEIIYCDDGSIDNTADIIRKLCAINTRVKLLKLSRNFGKENALAAAIHAATGDAILMIDGDGQHPLEAIPEFIAAWQDGGEVVIGLRTDDDQETVFKRLSSRSFYWLFNRLTGQKMIPRATDYRLIDRSVQQAFLSLTERDRVTRGLIDWLGFRRSFIPISRNERMAGTANYSLRKLVTLAANIFTSLSPAPLYLFGYIGLLITSLAFLLGAGVFIEQILFRDPLGWKFTGSAMLGILILFLVGLILISQGIISLYISHMHTQTKGRPLYVIDYKHSAGFKEDK